MKIASDDVLRRKALVKRYVTEHRSAETIELSTRAEVVATFLVSRAEVGAAFAKASPGNQVAVAAGTALEFRLAKPLSVDVVG